MKLREGKQVIYDLVKICDVVVENFPPGKAEKLGVDYKTLSELNSKIVYASITGFGPDGPYKERLAYDVIAGMFLNQLFYN